MILSFYNKLRRFLCNFYISNRANQTEKNLNKKNSAQPKAYIDELPVRLDAQGKAIYKIILVEEGKKVCGPPSYFLKKRSDILEMLSSHDAFRLGMGYYEEKYLPPE